MPRPVYERSPEDKLKALSERDRQLISELFLGHRAPRRSTNACGGGRRLGRAPQYEDQSFGDAVRRLEG